jgi:hypothetical protein
MRNTASILAAAVLFAACADPVPSPTAVPESTPLAAVVVAPCTGCPYGVVRFDRILGGRFEQATFTANAAGSWVLVVTDNGNARTGAEVLLNGVQHVAKTALEGAPTEVRIPVTLLASNTLLVRVFGDLGASVRVSIEPSTVATLTITPGTAERLPNGTLQFSVSAGPPGPYTWSVNGVDGGNSTFGTVSSTGFYSAPGAVPTPSSFQLCARVTATPAVRGCATVTINPIPTAGADVVVFNDVNLFDNTAMVDINNKRMVRNLVNYTGTGPRALGNTVVMENGHSSGYSQCFDASARAEMAAQGFTVTVQSSATIGAQPAGVKVLILCLPLTAYSRAEINNMKQFSSEGGRIVFVGEHSTFYGSGIPIENQFLIDMGAVMRNIGNFVDCGYNVQPTASLRAHQITTGMTQVTMACASVITLGPNDFALFYDLSNTLVLAGVAKVDVTPLPLVAADFTPSFSITRSVRARPTHDAIGNRLR